MSARDAAIRATDPLADAPVDDAPIPPELEARIAAGEADAAAGRTHSSAEARALLGRERRFSRH